MKIPDLYLLRHGQTVWNREGRLQGRLDSPLTDLGRHQAATQARLLAPILAARPDLAYIASPQGRAQHTARIVFGPAEFRTDARLREIDMGVHTGAEIARIAGCNGAGLSWYDSITQGEELAVLAALLSDFLGDLTGPAVVVTHGVPLQMLRVLALGQGRDRLDDLAQAQGAVYHITQGCHREITR